ATYRGSKSLLGCYNGEHVWFLIGCCMTWTEDLTVKGSVGGTVRIKCTHTNARSNAKYFCKETCRDKDVLITSETRRSDRPKYSIEDKGNAFFTTIRNLQLKDTGNYRCGIDRFGFDTYVRVHLKVNDGERIPFLCFTSISFFFLTPQHTSSLRGLVYYQTLKGHFPHLH
uniref:Immunoglobulin V-set domain-containing protein n=1 Tax=Gadus morhua TaxID=8049 RepID=A0A8C4ZBM9_GADMO